jgi:hypothetical protein
MTDDEILREVANLGAEKKQKPSAEKKESKSQRKEKKTGSLSETLKAVADLHKAFKTKSDQILTELMPNKITGLTAMMNSPKPYQPASLPNLLEGKSAARTIPTNSAVDDILLHIRTELQDMTDTMGTLKMFIQMNMPSVEESDDPRLDRSIETAAILVKTEEAGVSTLDKFSTYHVSRGKLVSKMLQFPEVEDYVQSIRQVDEEMWTHLRLCTTDIRTKYLLVRDSMLKNLEADPLSGMMDDSDPY